MWIRRRGDSISDSAFNIKGCRTWGNLFYLFFTLTVRDAGSKATMPVVKSRSI